MNDNLGKSKDPKVSAPAGGRNPQRPTVAATMVDGKATFQGGEVGDPCTDEFGASGYIVAFGEELVCQVEDPK